MDDLAYFLALNRAPGIGPAHFRSLTAHFGSPRALFEGRPADLDPARLPAGLREYLEAPDWAGVDADMRWAGAPGHHVLVFGGPGYPPRLAEIPDPPPLLFVRGDPQVLGLPQLAIVGSRNPTRDGKDNARGFAAALAGAGLVITSGLAYGVDAAAHEGALSVEGTSIAVAGTGPDTVYPARHRDLASRLVARGALLSEFPPGTPPLAAHFPRRNRIISGLSLGVLVVEAAKRSGSLITARLAAEQGREVLAIPGSIHNPLARGCHGLLRQGARLVETAGDVLEEIAPQLMASLTADGPAGAETGGEAAGPQPLKALDADYQRLLDALGFDPVPVDRLVERTGLTAEEVSSMLLILELGGHIASVPGGRYVRAVERE